MELMYTLSESARNDLFLATGVIEPAQQGLTCDPRELSTMARQWLLDLGALNAAGRLYLQYRDIQHDQIRQVNLVLSEVPSGPWQLLELYRAARAQAEGRVRAWQDSKIDELIDGWDRWDSPHSPPMFGLSPAEFNTHPRWGELETAWDHAKARAAALDARQRADRQAAYTAQTEAAEAQRAEIAAWISAHGSDKLKSMAGQGYEIIKQYARERSALEHPGYTLDLGRECQWAESDDPSEIALTLATEAGGRVVSLQLPQGGLGQTDMYGEFDYADPVEAVLIDNYLGVCPLFLVL